ncbi:MAG: MBL fold metallo-hydrolase [Candidatus Yanofskybacteria bacterium]|nr:MBL fold metallo-hydrolase [Candidatus Yanofskybacteria bacterium]
MSKVSFVAGGGANSIGRSFYRLKLGDYHLGVDWGGGYGSIYDEPQYDGPLDALLISHGHHDHATMVAKLHHRYPELKIFATAPTRDLSILNWRQTIKKALGLKQNPPFDGYDVERTLSMIRLFRVNEELKLNDEISVFPLPAGHILGAVSFLVSYQEEYYFFTNDICFHSRYLIDGAPSFRFERCRLLIRESTYINKDVGDREATKQQFIAAAAKVIERRGRLLVPGLSIDRIQDVFGDLYESGLWPIYIDGARKPTEIYLHYLDGRASSLGKALRFRNERERMQFLKSRQPSVIIASSGMIYPNTLSAFWAENLLYQKNDAIFIVNYQEPDGQGFLLKTAPDGKFIKWNDGIVQVRCERKDFNKSAHMDGPEGEALEERLNPDTIIYTHGENDEIDRYIASHQDKKQRIKALEGKEVEL